MVMCVGHPYFLGSLYSSVSRYTWRGVMTITRKGRTPQPIPSPVPLVGISTLSLRFNFNDEALNAKNAYTVYTPCYAIGSLVN